MSIRNKNHRIPWTHTLSQNELKPNDDKVQAIKNWKVPETNTQVQQFLGLAGSYRRFIKNSANIARPLHRLTQKNISFQWTHDYQQAFLSLTEALTKEPVLIPLNYSQPFSISTDASKQALGAVIEQEVNGKTHPVAYLPRVTTKCHDNFQ